MIKLLAILLLVSLYSCAPNDSYDQLITGGVIVDGSGDEVYNADILIRNGKISYIGEMNTDTIDVDQRFDANGYHLTPGFIDAHAHGDPLENPEFENFLAMGVTTILLGQDGGGPDIEGLDEHMSAVEGIQPHVNVAYLAGHNTIRRESGLGHDDPDDTDLDALAELVSQSMETGTFGISLGLEYDYGGQAEMPELIRIAEPVAGYDGIIMSHMRSEDYDKIEDSIEELIGQGKESGARVHASHLKIVLGNDPDQAHEILEMMDHARNEGVDISADVYPYNASFTGIGLLFPDWASPPNDYEEVVEERRGELEEYLRDRVNTRNGPEATLFGTGDYSGKTLAEVAEEEGRPFEEILIDLGPGGASAAYFVMDEDVMEIFIADPHSVISSDGSPTMRHPRGYGAFAKVLNEYTSDDKLLDLVEAVHKMSGQTASIIGLDDPEKVEVKRGYLREGYAADILMFNPDEVKDRADFEHPHELAEGMQMIWVNGQPAWEVDSLSGSDGYGKMIRNQIAR